MAAALKLHAAQMRFPLRRPAAADRGSFVLGGSKRAAAEALDAWPDASAPVLAVVGPAGAGKSHLGAVWAQRTGAASLKGAEAALADLPALEARPVFLDEADQADDETLFHLINLAHASGGALLLASREPPALWETPLPDLRSRLDALRVVRVEAPDDAVLAAVLRRLFAERAITPGDDLIDYLVRRIERSVPAAREVVERLDQDSGARPINRLLAREILDRGDRTGELFD